jgi:hypothetical protein
MSPASYNVWVAKPGNGTDYAVTRIGNKTNVRLGKASVTLAPVPLGNSESRTARGAFGLASGAPDFKLDMRVALKNPSNGVLLAPVNGGSCMASSGPIVK